MEFGGPGLDSLSPDERATLCNMATECSARSGVCEGDRVLAEWIVKQREGLTIEQVEAMFVFPDAGATYAGGVHTLDLSDIRPMVAEPGDPTYGKLIEHLAIVPIDIAYGGSCTAGKEDDFDFYARVLQDALQHGRRVADGVRMYVQYGSEGVRDYALAKGYDSIFQAAGVEILSPGCGACIGCGPGVSDDAEQTTVSAINRNFSGRSGPGRLYLASPLTVAASAVMGHIASYRPGMFAPATASSEA